MFESSYIVLLIPVGGKKGHETIFSLYWMLILILTCTSIMPLKIVGFASLTKCMTVCACLNELILCSEMHTVKMLRDILCCSESHDDCNLALLNEISVCHFFLVLHM